ncbi:unnamed protein product [Caenorhabditis sp. 36 PRJEB53466]|nr:unnamed protein product [Caenorhabditis sp. 36 PRJEB53466]
MEFINVKGAERILELPDGMEVLNHEETAFTNHYTDGKSFDDLEERKVDENSEPGIHFAIDFKVHKDGVNMLKKVGNQIQSNSYILQHNLIMYSYSYALSVVGKDANEGFLCQFRLVPISYTYRHPVGTIAGGVPNIYKPNAPELSNAKLDLGVGDPFDLVKCKDGTYLCETAIHCSSLVHMAQNGIATLRVEMTIDSGYFDIGEYVDLNLRQAHVAPNSHEILGKMLLGEVVPKSDWVITVGDGSPRDFHVHGAVLTDSCLTLRAALSNHMSIANIVAMVSHENRFILGSLKSKDMKVLLSYIYQRRYVLPEYDSVNRIGPVLTLFFREEMPLFFKSWEVELIKKVQQLDRSKTGVTVIECIKALIIVHTSPKGALLAAYNAALIVAADALQMAEAKGKKVKVEKVKKAIGKEWQLIDDVFELIGDLKYSICGVEKSKFVD